MKEEDPHAEEEPPESSPRLLPQRTPYKDNPKYELI